jgi:hypothetical protein
VRSSAASARPIRNGPSQAPLSAGAVSFLPVGKPGAYAEGALWDGARSVRADGPGAASPGAGAVLLFARRMKEAAN